MIDPLAALVDEAIADFDDNIPARFAEFAAAHLRAAGVRGPDAAPLREALAELEDWRHGRRSWMNLGPYPPYTPDVIAAMDAQEVVKLSAYIQALRADPAAPLRECKCSPLDGHDKHCEAGLDVDVLADSMRYGYAWTSVPVPDQWPAVARAVAAEYRRQLRAALATPAPEEADRDE